MSKKKQKKTVFNMVDEAMDALDKIGAKEAKPIANVKGGTESPAEKATGKDVQSVEVDEAKELDEGINKERILDAVSDSDVELNRLKSQLLEVKQDGIDIANELKEGKFVTKASKKYADNYTARKSFLDSISIGDAMQIGVMADVLPKQIKKLQDIMSNPDLDHDTKMLTANKLRKLKDEYNIIKAKEELIIEEHKLRDLQRVHEQELERKEAAKAKLDKLRIEYGDELIKSLIA